MSINMFLEHHFKRLANNLRNTVTSFTQIIGHLQPLIIQLIFADTLFSQNNFLAEVFLT